MGLDELSLLFDDYFPFLYTIVFFIGLKAFRQNTSLTVIAVVLALTEFSMYVIRDPLWAWANKNPNVSYDIRLMGWFGCWLICDLLVLQLLHKTHEWLNVTKTKEVQIIQSAYLVLAIFHLIEFSNITSVNFTLVNYAYQLGVPFINISVGLFLLTVLLRKTINVDFKVAIRRGYGD